MQQTAFRPSSVLVIAIFQFIFGGLGLLCDMYAGAAQASGSAGMAGGGGTAKQQEIQQNMTRDLERAMERRLPGHKTWTIALLLLDVLLCFMMIGSGVGLIQMQPWGRTLAMGGAALSVVLKVFNVVIGLSVTAPATKEVMAVYAQQLAGRDAATFVGFMDGFTKGMVWGPACFAIYPILVLVVLLQPGVVAAFEAHEQTAAAPITDPDEQGHFRPDSGGPTDPDERFRI